MHPPNRMQTSKQDAIFEDKRHVKSEKGSFFILKCQMMNAGGFHKSLIFCCSDLRRFLSLSVLMFMADFLSFLCSRQAGVLFYLFMAGGFFLFIVHDRISFYLLFMAWGNFFVFLFLAGWDFFLFIVHGRRMAELPDLQFDSILLCISATANSFYWQTAFLQAIYLSIASRKEENEGSNQGKQMSWCFS